jgi:hypothetical protein
MLWNQGLGYDCKHHDYKAHQSSVPRPLELLSGSGDCSSAVDRRGPPWTAVDRRGPPWTAADDELLLERQTQICSKWSELRQWFPERIGINLKNRFH